MRLAVMQPYFFPYIGYFQLMAAVDRFVLLDDVTYINRGWINRNRILVNGKPHLFTVPLQNASQNVLIADLKVTANEKWRTKFMRTVECAYRKAPHYEAVVDLLSYVFATESLSFREWLRRSIRAVCEYLELQTEIVDTSRQYGNQDLKGQARIIDICHREGASCYVNPPGGRTLYSGTAFAAEGIDLRFLDSDDICYKQFGEEFVPWLSIIDVLMFVTPGSVRRLLECCSLLNWSDFSGGGTGGGYGE